MNNHFFPFYYWSHSLKQKLAPESLTKESMRILLVSYFIYCYIQSATIVQTMLNSFVSHKLATVRQPTLIVLKSNHLGFLYIYSQFFRQFLLCWAIILGFLWRQDYFFWLYQIVCIKCWCDGTCVSFFLFREFISLSVMCIVYLLPESSRR